MEIAGKTALITGGSVRLGKALTLAYAHSGANVLINYYSSETEAQNTAAEARKMGVKAAIYQANVADNTQVQNMIAFARQQFGGVDILINSASLFKKTPFPDPDTSAWKEVSSILIDGAYHCANAVAADMLKKGSGVILQISDLSAWQPWRDFSAHSIGKAALLALTRQLALELAPQVRVNAIAPGAVLAPPDYSPEKRQVVANRNLLKTWGSPADVAETALFLTRSDFITGEVIFVDGGEHLKNTPG